MNVAHKIIASVAFAIVITSAFAFVGAVAILIPLWVSLSMLAALFVFCMVWQYRKMKVGGK